MKWSTGGYFFKRKQSRLCFKKNSAFTAVYVTKSTLTWRLCKQQPTWSNQRAESYKLLSELDFSSRLLKLLTRFYLFIFIVYARKCHSLWLKENKMTNREQTFDWARIIRNRCVTAARRVNRQLINTDKWSNVGTITWKHVQYRDHKTFRFFSFVYLAVYSYISYI